MAHASSRSPSRAPAAIGAKPSCCPRVSGMIVFDLISRSRRSASDSLLLAAGADPNVPNAHGEDAIDLAKKKATSETHYHYSSAQEAYLTLQLVMRVGRALLMEGEAAAGEAEDDDAEPEPEPVANRPKRSRKQADSVQ